MTRTPARRVLLGFALLNLFVIGLAAAWLTQSRQRMEAEAAQNTRNLAHSLAISISGALDKIDLGLADVAHDCERQLAGGGLQTPATQAYLTRQKALIRDFEELWVADARGDILWGTQLPADKPVNIADREYYQRLCQAADPGLVVSRPVLGRLTKAWSMVVARRINRPDGTMAGLVLGSLRVDDYFMAKFAEFQVGRWGRIILRDEGLGLVFRYPHLDGDKGLPGSTYISYAGGIQVARHPLAGAYQGTSPDDRMARTYSYQKVGSYPYVVFVAQSLRETLVPWWQEVGATAFALAGFLLFTIYYARDGLLRLQAKEEADQKTLAKSEAMFRAVLDHSREGILFTDAQGIILYRSRSFKNFNGVEDEARLGKQSFDLVHPEDETQVRAAWQRMLEDPATHHRIQCRIKHTDGSWRWIEANLRNLLEHPQVGAVVIASRNLTQERAAEEARRTLESQMNHLQRMESVGRLASGISHDMNNVLAAIMAVAQALQQQGGAFAPQIDLILDATRRGRTLVQGLLAFARKEMEEAEVFDLNELVRKEAELLSSTTLQRVKVNLELTPDLPQLAGSPSALATALMNLCVNAIDAMPGGGALTLRTLDTDGKTVELAVEDTGHGMPPEVVSRAMEPFFTTKPVGKGTGLGLAMVFGTVQAHGGTMEIQSRVGKGTTVHLHLPKAGRELPARAAVTAPPTSPDRPLLRILLVDDDLLVRMATELLLDALGHAVTPAEGGLQALALAEGGGDWDVAMLDLNMPDLDGLETLTRLRRLRPALPALIATGYADEEVLRNLARFERVALLNKPYSLDEFEGGLAHVTRES